MNREEIENLIRRFFNEEFEIPLEKIVPEATLFEDLGLDSIDALDMVGMLEAQLGIEVREVELQTVRTIGDVTGFVWHALEGKKG